MNDYGYYLLGGLLIGAGTALIFWVTGKPTGASGVLSVVVSYVSNAEVLRRLRSQRAGRLLFMIGTVLGGLLFTLTVGDSLVPESHAYAMPPLWQLGLGGFLVGLGTRAARGCTSGHGICGLSSRSQGSLVHVMVFMGVAVATAWITGSLL